GTAATPLEVIINVNAIINCWPMLRSIPAACATNIDANERYNDVPSKLKLYPVGITKDTTFRGTPKRSIFSIAFGNAASELVVAKAIETGSLIASMNFFRGTFKYKAIGNKIKNKKANSAIYKLINSINKFLSMSTPR